MALQRYGEIDMDRLLSEMEKWSVGTALEKRAAIAAVCEPRLLKQPRHVLEVLEILDRVTTSIEFSIGRKDEGFLTLRKGLGYCWSVAVAALPNQGKAKMERWLINPDRDVHWIMKQNLKKKRLSRMDEHWVQKWQERFNS